LKGGVNILIDQQAHISSLTPISGSTSALAGGEQRLDINAAQYVE
jgi:hypothetical protein